MKIEDAYYLLIVTASVAWYLIGYAVASLQKGSKLNSLYSLIDNLLKARGWTCWYGNQNVDETYYELSVGGHKQVCNRVEALHIETGRIIGG